MTDVTRTMAERVERHESASTCLVERQAAELSAIGDRHARVKTEHRQGHAGHGGEKAYETEVARVQQNSLANMALDTELDPLREPPDRSATRTRTFGSQAPIGTTAPKHDPGG